MGKKKEETANATVTATPTTEPSRYIGELEVGVEIPGPKAGAKPAVWKDTIAPMQVGQTRLVVGVKLKSLEQSVYTTARKHFPTRKYKVWSIGPVEMPDKSIQEGFRIGRLPDKEVVQQPVATVATTQTVETLPVPPALAIQQ